jgi:hypothetical protein
MFDPTTNPDGELSITTRRLPNAARMLLDRKERVESLKIRSTDGDTMPPELVSAMRRARCLRGVKRLEVDEIDLGRKALKLISGARRFSRLEELVLSDCDWHSKLGDTIPIVLARARLKTLTALHLAVDFGPAGIEALASSKKRAGLRRLSLHGAKLGDAGFRALVDSALFQHLSHVSLSEIGVSERSVDLLMNVKRPASLLSFELREFSLDEELQEALRAWAQ